MGDGPGAQGAPISFDSTLTHIERIGTVPPLAGERLGKSATETAYVTPTDDLLSRPNGSIFWGLMA